MFFVQPTIMKHLFSILFVFLFSQLIAQKKIEAPVNIYYVQQEQDILVYDNEGYCPYDRSENGA